MKKVHPNPGSRAEGLKQNGGEGGGWKGGGRGVARNGTAQNLHSENSHVLATSAKHRSQPNAVVIMDADGCTDTRPGCWDELRMCSLHVDSRLLILSTTMPAGHLSI